MPPENSSYKLSSPGGNISQSRWSALMSAPFETVICRISQVAAFIAASLAGLTVAGSLLNLQVLTATFCAEAPLPLLSRTGIFFVALALLLFTCSTEKDKPSRLVQLLALAGILAGCGDPQNTCLQARFCLALVGSGVLCLSSERVGTRNLAQYFAMIVGWASTAALLVYLYGLSFVLHVGVFSAIPLRAAIMFFFVAAALFLARPLSGPASVLLADGAGGTVARRLFLPSCLLFPFMGVITGAGPRYEADLTVLALFANFVAPVFVWFIACRLDRSEVSARKMEKEIERQARCLQARNRVYKEALTCQTEEQLSKTCLAVAEWLSGSKFGYLGRLNAEGLQDILAINNPGREACALPLEQSADSLKNMPIRGVDRTVLRDGVSRIINGVEAIKAHPDHFECPPGHPVLTSFLGVPLKDSDRVIGLIALANKENGFTEPDREDLESLSIAIVEAFIRKRAELYGQKLNVELKQANKELEKARNEAQKASRFKSQFVASVSHEIRTPLNGLLGMSEVLATTELNEQQRHYVNSIIEAGQDLQSVVKEVLNFAKIEAGKLVLESSELDVINLVENVSELFAPIAAAKGISIVTFVEPTIPAGLKGDPVRLREILYNLTSNAIKFSDGGEIVLKVTLEALESASAGLLFSVSDEGIGLSEKQIVSLFEPFNQASSSISHRRSGTGLGLFICRGLVNLMGGKISVCSKENEGSTFYFSLTLPRSDKFVPAVPFPTVVPAERVLVVEDRPKAGQIMQEYLASWKIRADLVTGAQEGLKMLHEAVAQKEPYEAAFIGLSLPVKNGADMARQILEDTRLKKTKVIMVTAFERGLPAEDFTIEGCRAFLRKPIKQTQLLNVLQELNQDYKKALPALEKKSVLPDRPAPGKKPQVAQRSENILVAEDYPINQEVAVLLLKNLGFKAKVVQNGREALDALKQGAYSLVLMDVQMPEIDGLEATRLFREHEKITSGHVPVVAMTAHATDGCREECFESGMDDYISKPVNAQNLRQILDKWLPQSAAAEVQSPCQEELADAEPPIDLKTLELHYGQENIEHLVEILVTDVPQHLQDLAQAVVLKDVTTCARSAHGLKGVFKTVYAGRLWPVCSDIEKAAQEKDWTRVETLVHNLESEFRRVQEFLKS